MFVVKRAIPQEELDDSDQGERVVADPEGWIIVSDVLGHSRMSDLDTTFDDIQRIVATAAKARFDMRQQKAEANADDPASWQISRITTGEAVTSLPLEGARLTTEMTDLPEFVIYETSYQRYPRLLALGAITRAPGGSQYRTFWPVAVDKEGSEWRQNTGPGEAAEVRIWIHLRKALQAEPSVTWHRSENGMIVTDGDVPMSLWTKAIARRPDIGLLFENGQVRKDVPGSLRGKGFRGKTRRNRGTLTRGGSGDDSGSASEE